MDQVTRFSYNRDWQRRNAILGPFLAKKSAFAECDIGADILYFQDVPVEVVAQLLDERYLNPAERQNDSPTVKEFFAFMQRHPGVLAHGYAIGIVREDYRVSIEGISFRGAVSDGLRRDVLQVLGNADECSVGTNGIYVWFD